MLSIRTTTLSTCLCSLDLTQISTYADNGKSQKRLVQLPSSELVSTGSAEQGTTDHVLQVKHVLKLLAEVEALVCSYRTAKDVESPDKILKLLETSTQPNRSLKRSESGCQA